MFYLACLADALAHDTDVAVLATLGVLSVCVIMGVRFSVAVAPFTTGNLAHNVGADTNVFPPIACHARDEHGVVVASRETERPDPLFPGSMACRALHLVVAMLAELLVLVLCDVFVPAKASMAAVAEATIIHIVAVEPMADPTNIAHVVFQYQICCQEEGDKYSLSVLR